MMCLFFTIEILVKKKPAWVDSKGEGGTKERRDGDRSQHIIVNKETGMASQSLACHSYERFHVVGSPMRLIITVRILCQIRFLIYQLRSFVCRQLQEFKLNRPKQVSHINIEYSLT